jgi:DNA replication protein DnaC
MQNSTTFREKIKARPRLVYKEYDFPLRWDSFKRTAEHICPGFVIDDSNKQIYEEACRYFAADDSCSWDLNKGIYLYGDIGVGKTLFYKIFHHLMNAPGIESNNKFSMLTVNDIVDGYSVSGPAYWKTSGINAVTPGEYNQPVHLFIDDLGQNERVASYFGNSVDVITELIQRRYYAFTDNYVLTHASSNIIPSEIKETFGQFTASRMREMFNVLLFPGGDRRK